jgi:acyl-CoA hydrolase
MSNSASNSESSAGLADGGAVLMDSTRLSNTFTCQPQSRNMHGRIFGGFLMRRAYELAYATVHMFAGSKPKFIQVDRVRAPLAVYEGAGCFCGL